MDTHAQAVAPFHAAVTATLPFWMCTTLELPSSSGGANVRALPARTHAVRKQMWREFPLAAAGCVIIWDSLPLTSKYGWDCEASRRQRGTPLVMSELRDSRWLEIRRKEFQERKNHRKAILSRTPVNSERWSSCLVFSHTHSSNVFFLPGRVAGEMFLPVKSYFSSPHPRDPRSWLPIPSISCSVWGLWFVVVFPSPPSESEVMAWTLAASQSKLKIVNPSSSSRVQVTSVCPPQFPLFLYSKCFWDSVFLCCANCEVACYLWFMLLFSSRKQHRTYAKPKICLQSWNHATTALLY